MRLPAVHVTLGSDMTGELMRTPAANRLHIGFFGCRNSGKSSLLNALVGQDMVIVSDIPGTTTDPVRKNMEIYGIGACTLVDTAGIDDVGELGLARVSKTWEVLREIDIAVMVFNEGTSIEMECWQRLKEGNAARLAVLSKNDLPNRSDLAKRISKAIDEEVLLLSAKDGVNIENFRQQLIRLMPADFEAPSITAALVSPKDVVVLVMPQDIQAPKGRLILPQVQVIRDLLDQHCLVFSCTTAEFEDILAVLKDPPALIITDSQAFGEIFWKKPEVSQLTSFSILMAAFKGDIHAFKAGAEVISQLTQNARILIAEACTHAPLEEDIGRVKIPRMLRQKISQELEITVVSGKDFPKDLTPYDLIIHCGACMFNRRYVLSRIAQAHHQGVPITNYGMALAELQGILDDVVYPI